MKPIFLVLPGIGNSGPKHWQTHWEQSHGEFQRIHQRDWDHPVRTEWVESLEKTVGATGPQTILVAHSLACLLVAHWATTTCQKIKAAFLVAVPDPTGASFPKEAVGFAPVPLQKFPFPSIAVVSEDDPYGPMEFAERCALAWDSRLVDIGAAGHINGSSNLGSWPDGFALLQSLVAPPGPATA
jgi:predicted alpha/beta hydrolase family esterase